MLRNHYCSFGGKYLDMTLERAGGVQTYFYLELHVLT